ncbi:hypothetical protein FB45DRAFT_956750 [Roridomyces roridus]|uniref:F-box domain-containing protein n=1 Tax=Roridomyces roridus TaxID=1738132 RepID=A0AAD7F6B4_9AGAR|nr:hypothetical protein FB45DRAFT_956750 [Roridomyces roridus]
MSNNRVSLSNQRTHASPPIPLHLLASNAAPLEAEIQFLKSLLAQTEADIAAIKASPLLVTDKSASTPLVKNRKALVACAKQYKTLLAPVRRVPAELICEILARVPCTRAINFRETYEQPPWVLTHICRSWREIALGAPLL